MYLFPCDLLSDLSAKALLFVLNVSLDSFTQDNKTCEPSLFFFAINRSEINMFISCRSKVQPGHA